MLGDFFSFPGYFVVFKRVGRGDALTVHNQKLFVEVDTDVYVVEPFLPLFVDLVLEGEFDVAAADFSAVDEEERHFVWSERLFPDDVVDDGLRLVVAFCREPE